MFDLHSGMQMQHTHGCNRVILYYFSYTIYKVKGEWCMIVCDTYKDSDKAFLDSGYSGRFVPYKREYTEKQIATLLELFSPIIQ